MRFNGDQVAFLGGFHQLSLLGCIGSAREHEYKYEDESGPAE